MKFRHGDVILVRVASQKKSNLKPLKHLVLAEGEATGHAHRITKGKAKLYDTDEPGVRLLSVGEEGAELTHEEHKPIALPKGDYKIRIQREYIPEGWRYVAD